MSYATLLTDEKVAHRYLVKLSPYRRIQSASLFSGSTYSLPVSLGEVVAVIDQGQALTQVSTTSLGAGEFYYDTDNEVLYVRLSGGQNPNTRWVIYQYEINMGTVDAHWYRIPTDIATRTVYWDPVIIEEPRITRNLSDSLAGYVPVQSTSLRVNNAEHFLEKHLVASSFHRAAVDVWHWIGELDTANIKKVLTGYADAFTYSDETVSFKVKDQFDLFSLEYRHPTGEQTYLATDFPSLDKTFEGRPVRKVFGVVDGFQPVNLDYVSESPTTSDNRDWGCVNHDTTIPEKVLTVANSPSSTTTRTYLVSAEGIQVGDTVILDSATDYYREVTVVDKSGTPFIEHAAVGTALSPGDVVRRGFVGHVKIIKENVTYTALYGRDYTVATFGSKVRGFSFVTGLEANLSIPTLQANDRVLARVYGPETYITLGGPFFGSDSEITGNMANPCQLILDLLKTQSLVPDAEINTSSFTTALTDSTDTLGISIPMTAQGTQPKIKDLLIQYLKSGLVRLTLDADRKWYLKAIKPFSSNDRAIDSTEIVDNSFQWDVDYNDLASLVVVEYGRQEASYVGQGFGAETSKKASFESPEALYLHRARKTLNISTLHVDELEATQYAERMSYNFGSHDSSVKLRARSSFFETLIGDVVSVSRPGMPGVGFDQDTYQTKSIVVLSTSRDIESIDLVGTDQDGIQTNISDW